MQNEIKLGLIGSSEGNGHPYSWSAIINGYDQAKIKTCGFPVISEYLSSHLNNSSHVQGARVTHVWTQDPIESKKIADTTFIETVVPNLGDLVNEVDAILLARDDASNHLIQSRLFIESGLPIYIDKPLAFTKSQALKILKLQKYPGQVFSCSAFNFSPELEAFLRNMKRIGKIKHIYAFTP